eukprot:COSAG01_NODE_459_length_16728_cov_50.324794_6_plen_272_part_00
MSGVCVLCAVPAAAGCDATCWGVAGERVLALHGAWLLAAAPASGRASCALPASCSMAAHHVWLRGVPANPPRAIAFVVKEALGLRRTPNVLPKPATTEALVLCQAESDTATALRHAAVPASAVANQLERRLGASVTLEARAEGCWDVDTPPVDGRSWGRWVTRRHPASALAQVVEGDDGAHGCGASRRWGVKAVAARRAAGRAAAAVAKAEGLTTGAALRVLWAGATEPRGLRAALGGFDDHFSEVRRAAAAAPGAHTRQQHASVLRSISS